MHGPVTLKGVRALDLLWRNDIDPEHVVFGLSFYGRSFTLANPSCATPGCVFSPGGNPGPCTASAGTLSYSEIRKVIDDGANVEQDNDAAVKMVTWGGNQWVSYDDEETPGMKVDYANSRCLGGTMVGLCRPTMHRVQRPRPLPTCRVTQLCAERAVRVGSVLERQGQHRNQHWVQRG